MENEMGWTEACCCWTFIIAVILLAAGVYLRIRERIREPKILAAREQRNELINKLQELHPIVKSVCAEMAFELFTAHSLQIGLTAQWKAQLEEVMSTARKIAKELGEHDMEDWLMFQDTAWEQQGYQSRSWTLGAICPLEELITEEIELFDRHEEVEFLFKVYEYTIKLVRDKDNQWCFVLGSPEGEIKTPGTSDVALRQGLSQLKHYPSYGGVSRKPFFEQPNVEILYSVPFLRTTFGPA